MTSDYNGRIAVVTGGASGIGEATTARLRSAGATVITFDVVDVVPTGAGEHRVVDITDPAEVDDAVSTIGDRYSAIDLLVNNAGIGAIGTIEDGDLEEWRRVFEVNIFGLIHVTRSALPLIRKSQGRAIVNVSSLVASAGIPKRAAYTASKGAVSALTLSMANDLLADGIRVNAVAPGTVGTPWVERLLAASDDVDAERLRLAARQPIGRVGTADEIAAVIAFLGSSAASFVNGSIWGADGGMAGLRVPAAAATDHKSAATPLSRSEMSGDQS